MFSVKLLVNYTNQYFPYFTNTLHFYVQNIAGRLYCFVFKL